MDARKIEINIESISELIDNLKNETLNKFLKNYFEALSQILTSISLPVAFMGIGMRKAVTTRFTIQDLWTVVRLVENPDKNPKDMAKKLVSHFEMLLNKNQEDIKKEMDEEINSLFDNYAETKIYHRDIVLTH